MSEKNTSNSNYSRRKVIQAASALGVAGTTGLAGCLGGDDGDENGDENGSENGDENGNEAGQQEMELVHWWTAGGEEEALNALLTGFLDEYGYDESNINENPAPGGAGSAVDAAIQSRIIDQDPPSSFQIWPGESLRPYTDADVLADIGDIWTDDMQDAYVQGVQDTAQPDGNYVSVPINIHRLNNLFYNTDVLDDAGVDPTDINDPEQLLDALQTIDDAGYTAFAHQTGSVWSTLQLWETVFIGYTGVDDFMSFLDRDVDGLEEEIRASLQLLVDYREYFSPDSSSIAWDEANGQVIDGEAAFIHQGDWAAGQYGATDLTYGEEWDHVPFPGTEGTYSLVMDSFVMPEPNPTPELTKDFLTYCGSIDAQQRFNSIKGSIPPRTDVPSDEFGPFLESQMDDFENSDQQPPTIAHGSGIDPQGKSVLEEIFSGFIENWDAEATTSRILDEL
jgi:glucose/mannose transport system substrate-binding protein